MTPQQQDKQEAAQIDMGLASERVHKALHGEDEKSDPYSILERCENCEELKLDVMAGKDDVALCPDCVKALAKPTRAPRKDKGSKRVKPEPPAAAMGKLTKEDASRLLDLMGTLDSSTRTERDLHDAFSAATRSRKAAETELAEFIADHTA